MCISCESSVPDVFLYSIYIYLLFSVLLDSVVGSPCVKIQVPQPIGG